MATLLPASKKRKQSRFAPDGGFLFLLPLSMYTASLFAILLCMLFPARTLLAAPLPTAKPLPTANQLPGGKQPGYLYSSACYQQSLPVIDSTTSFQGDRYCLFNDFAFTHQKRTALYKPVPCPSRMRLTKSLRIIVDDRGFAVFRNPKGDSWYFYPGSSVRLRPGQEPGLIYGRYIHTPARFSGELQPEDFRIRFFPEHPEPGRTVRIHLYSRKALDSLSINLPKKLYSFFYFNGKQEGWYQYIARFGIDVQNPRGFQHIQIRAQSEAGQRFLLRETLLFASKRQKLAAAPPIFGREEAPDRIQMQSLWSSISFQPPPRKTRKKFFQHQANILPSSAVLRKAQKEVVYPKSKKKKTLSSSRQLYQAQLAIHKEVMAASPPRQLWEGAFIYPATHWFSSIFGEVRKHKGAHRGIDIASPFNTPIKAPNNGIILYAGHNITYGKNVVIDHGQYIFTKIFHMQTIKVKQGQFVHKGDILGTVGSTGFSSGPHIHWEMWVGSTRVNPEEWGHNFFDVSPSLPPSALYKRRLAEFLRSRL